MPASSKQDHTVHVFAAAVNIRLQWQPRTTMHNTASSAQRGQQQTSQNMEMYMVQLHLQMHSIKPRTLYGWALISS